MNPFDTMTPVERLTAALVLAVTAPDGREAEIDFMVNSFAVGLTDEEVEEAKAAAEAEVTVRVVPTSTLPSPEELKKRRQS